MQRARSPDYDAIAFAKLRREFETWLLSGDETAHLRLIGRARASEADIVCRRSFEAILRFKDVEKERTVEPIAHPDGGSEKLKRKLPRTEFCLLMPRLWFSDVLPAQGSKFVPSSIDDALFRVRIKKRLDIAYPWLDVCNERIKSKTLQRAAERKQRAPASVESANTSGTPSLCRSPGWSLLYNLRMSFSPVIKRHVAKDLQTPPPSRRAKSASASPLLSERSGKSVPSSPHQISLHEFRCLDVAEVLSIIAATYLEFSETATTADHRTVFSDIDSCSSPPTSLGISHRKQVQSFSPVQSLTDSWLCSESTDMSVFDDDSEFDGLQRDLENLSLKKRWLAKEAQIRAAVTHQMEKTALRGSLPEPEKMEETSDTIRTDTTNEVRMVKNVEFAETLFSGKAATELLINDLLRIQQRQLELGISVRPIDDNIYHWRVVLLPECFGAAAALEVTKFVQVSGFGGIELDIRFTMDLHPFYPPSVRVLRPLFDSSCAMLGFGCLPTRIALLPSLRPTANLSRCSTSEFRSGARRFFDPCADMTGVLQEIIAVMNEFFENGGKIEKMLQYSTLSVAGSCADVGHLIAQLELLTHENEKSPLVRASGRIQKLDKTSNEVRNRKFLGFETSVGDSELLAYCLSDRECSDYVEIVADLTKSENAVAIEATSRTKTNQYWAAGTGYGHSQGGNESDWDMARYWVIQLQRDAQLEDVLRNLADACAALHRASRTMAPVAIHALSLMDNSSLIPNVEAYFRNESLLDMARHVNINKAVLCLVSSLLGSDDDADFAMQTTLPGVRAVFMAACSLVFDSDGSNLSLATLLKKLERRAGMFLKRSGVASEQIDAPESALARLILDVAARADLRFSQLSRLRSSSGSPRVEIAVGTEPSAEISMPCISSCDPLNTEAKKKDDCDVKSVENDMSAEAPASVNVESLDCSDEQYCKVMEDLQFDTVDMLDPDAPDYVRHHYSENFTTADAPSHSKIFRLASEQSSLACSLPLSVSSSVWVRTDENRIDAMRCLITGPAGTPYEAGCFYFDVYFPADYPNVPPKINLQTTGHGTVRFNPNLYNCGKVCLSLLGTWPGNQDEQWNGATSTLLQALVSIQSLILCEQPYFNEPGYERSMGTRAGDEESALYNQSIQESTIQHAILGQLRKPAPGFGDVVRLHFLMRRHHVLQNVKKWIQDAHDSGNTSTAARMESQLAALTRELDALPSSLLPP